MSQEIIDVTEGSVLAIEVIDRGVEFFNVFDRLTKSIDVIDNFI